ncbi:hypothetical protein chiPu_0004913 [Chiloscyllium punctatum]|uniref:Uncharacterized protein n=1 Tax=Chiloscyllium punctatum TaxID=137246 RepID=A0A401S7Z2_CHIPU|nr:hypothetical protein [Chiloscyllium punctatum]
MLCLSVRRAHLTGGGYGGVGWVRYPFVRSFLSLGPSDGGRGEETVKKKNNLLPPLSPGPEPPPSNFSTSRAGCMYHRKQP